MSKAAMPQAEHQAVHQICARTDSNVLCYNVNGVSYVSAMKWTQADDIINNAVVLDGAYHHQDLQTALRL